MELYGVPAAPDPQASEREAAGGCTQPRRMVSEGLERAAAIGEKGTDLIAGMFDRLLEADALGYDNEGDQPEN